MTAAPAEPPSARATVPVRVPRSATAVTVATARKARPRRGEIDPSRQADIPRVTRRMEIPAAWKHRANPPEYRSTLKPAARRARPSASPSAARTGGVSPLWALIRIRIKAATTAAPPPSQTGRSWRPRRLSSAIQASTQPPAAGEGGDEARGTVFIQREAYLKKGLGKRKTTRRSRAPISRKPMARYLLR